MSVVFVVDKSTSIDSAELSIMKSFMAEVTAKLNDRSEFGLVQFNQEATAKWGFVDQVEALKLIVNEDTLSGLTDVSKAVIEGASFLE